MTVLISKLEVHNFKKLTNVEFDFEQGLNTVYGPNFSGKSTLLEAIIYALYGSSALAGNADDLSNAEAPSAKPHVKLTFSNEYSIERKGGSVTFSNHGGVLSRSATAVLPDLEAMTGLSKAELMKTRVSKQGEAQVLLATGNAELKKLVEDLSGCALIDKVLQLAKDRATQLKAKVETRQELFEGDEALAEKEASLGALKEEAEIMALQVIRAEDEGVRLDRDYEAASMKLKQAQEEAHKQAVLASVISELEDRKKATKLALSELPIPMSSFKLKEMEEARDRASSSLLVAEKKLKTAVVFEANHKAAQKNLNDLEKALSEVPEVSPKEVDDLKSGVDEITMEQGSKTEVLAKLMQAVDSGICSECSRPYDEHFDIDQAKEDIDELVEELADLDDRKKAISKRLSRMEKDLSLRQTYERQANSARAELEDVLNSKPEKLKPSEELENDTEVLSQQASKLRDSVYLAVKEKDAYIALENDRKDIQDKLDESLRKVKPVADFDDLLKKTKELGERLAEANSALSHARSRADSIEATIKQLVEQIAFSNRLKEQIKQESKKLVVLKSLTSFITKNRGVLMNAVWAGILEEATNFVSSVTSGYVSAVQVDKNFNVQYQENGHLFPISNASGSQKTLISLGIRLGITNMLPSNVQFLLVDEITADMEEEISVTAMALAKKRSPQIISVSHRPSDMSASDNLIEMER